MHVRGDDGGRAGNEIELVIFSWERRVGNGLVKGGGGSGPSERTPQGWWKEGERHQVIREV